MQREARRHRAPRRRRWHRAYYLLAVFNLLVVALGLFLTHQIVGTHQDASRVDEVWQQRLDRYLDLGTVAGEVNAPGNDVFGSGDVAGETARQQAALRHFEVLAAMIRTDLAGVAPRYARVLRADLERVEARMSEMVAEADLVFGHLARGRAGLAGSRMAAMNRRYHAVNTAIGRTREDVRDIQRDLLARQDQRVQALCTFGYLTAGLVVLVVCGAVLHRPRGLAARGRREQQVRVFRAPVPGRTARASPLGQVSSPRA